MPAYPVPAQTLESCYEVKKSRFIARAALASDRQAAMELLAKAKQDYPDARHHCWAYVLGAQQSVAMSDDGEPSGTAGKPILNVLQHKQIGDIMLIVIRYFGGIKLGAGGLVRAYSTAAGQVLEQLPLVQAIEYQSGIVHCDFAQEQNVRHQIAHLQGQILDCQYQQGVSISLKLPLDQLAPWQAYLANHQLTWQAKISL